MSDKKPLDPYKTDCVCKHEGREVGRIAATAPNAETYITALASEYGELQIEYVERDTSVGLLGGLFGRRRF